MSSEEKIYNLIIVGAGMAGLYTAFLLKLHNPKTSILIIEQNSKEHLGGRANTELFYGTKIAIGAGIGRYKKDKHLAHLMKFFNMKIETYTVDHHIATTSMIDVPNTMRQLKIAYEKKSAHLKKHPQTFETFATHVLGTTDYNRFLNSTGFTDYQKEDAYETIYEYGMEDNLGGWKAFSVPWHELGEKLAQKIGTSNFIFNKKAISIQKKENLPYMILKTKSSLSNSIVSYKAEKIVVATTIDTVRKLLPAHPLYKEIEPQPFLRVYGKFDKSSVGILKEVLPKFTYVDFPIQKIIPMNVYNGVYMIVYNDNESALELKNKTENTVENRRFYEKCLEKVLRLPTDCLHLQAIRSFYWNYGTHYYKPLSSEFTSREEFIKKAQMPTENIFVVGELVSRNQGWTEGAFESVAEVIDKIK